MHSQIHHTNACVFVFVLLLPLLHLDKLAVVAVDKPSVDVDLDIEILLCLDFVFPNLIESNIIGQLLEFRVYP